MCTDAAYGAGLIVEGLRHDTSYIISDDYLFGLS